MFLSPIYFYSLRKSLSLLLNLSLFSLFLLFSQEEIFAKEQKAKKHKIEAKEKIKNSCQICQKKGKYLCHICPRKNSHSSHVYHKKGHRNACQHRKFCHKKWNVSGLFLLRKEALVTTKEDTKDLYKVNHKYKFLVKGEYQIHPHIDLAVQLRNDADNTRSSKGSLKGFDSQNQFSGAFFGLSQFYATYTLLLPEEKENRPFNLSIQAGRFPLPIWMQTDGFWDKDIQTEGFATRLSFLKAFDWNFGYSMVRTPQKFYSSLLKLEDFFLTNQIKWNHHLNSSHSFTLAGTIGNMFDKNDKGHILVKSGEKKEFSTTHFYLASAQWKIKKNKKKSVKLGIDGLMSSAKNGDTKNSKGFVAFAKGKYKKWKVGISHYNIGEASAPFIAAGEDPYGRFFTQNDFYSPHQLPRAVANLGFSGEKYEVSWNFVKNMELRFIVYRHKTKDSNLFAAYQKKEGYDANKSSWKYRCQVTFYF